MAIEYHKIIHSDASEELLDECAQLFSSHYGTWSLTHKKAGQRITLKGPALHDFLPGESSWIATAREEKRLVGYALVVLTDYGPGPITWVTQLVVHEAYQNMLVGSTLLMSIWGFSEHFAWGLVSANPYAVRALEKATRRRCDYRRMQISRSAIEGVLEKVGYTKDREIAIKENDCRIDTKFDQDLSALPEKLRKVSEKTHWTLGNLNAGEEWLAVTFRNQKQMRWTDKEQSTFLKLSDDFAIKAYNRMAEADPQQNHAWADPKRAADEVAFLIEVMGLNAGSKILDVGCGGGRHSIPLAKAGMLPTGVDYSDISVRNAQRNARKEKLDDKISFQEADCRSVKLHEQFDAVICLYDVVGSSPEDQSNIAIIENAIRHLRPGGWIALSVMSFEYINANPVNVFDGINLDTQLNALPASNSMQNSGEVFDSKYLLIDQKKKIIYRKETFDAGSLLPLELIVRDRRYDKGELEEICRRFSLSVHHIGFVRAGNFRMVREARQEPTKEILVVAQKGIA